MKTLAIDCIDLEKVYESRKLQGLIPPKWKTKRVTALNSLSLQVKRGEIMGLLGPNGAGKTTTIQILAGLLVPDNGDAYIHGINAIAEPERVKRIVGVVAGGDTRQLYNKLNARENLRYWGHLHGMDGPYLEERIDFLLELVGLQDRQDDEFEKFSLGMSQRLVLARGMIHDPEVLLLDEPTLGLDPKASREMRSFIKKKLVEEQEKTILLTTHEMHVAEELSDRIAIINRGSIVALDEPSKLREMVPNDFRIQVDIRNITPQIQQALSYNGLVVQDHKYLEHENVDRFVISTDDEERAIKRVIDAVRLSEEARLVGIDLREATLEDAFVFLTDDNLEVSVNA
ncbi:MAG: ATP-binding cassette domain-containing protein [Candidatus Lokiarchaeota archaeon]|nr:ATP-binding cassette domain-containing protein [Candidatus Lokiarchaeota archaeon]